MAEGPWCLLFIRDSRAGFFVSGAIIGEDMEQLSPEFLVQGLIWYIVFLFSTTCHEASHALVAKLGGDLTAFYHTCWGDG